MQAALKALQRKEKTVARSTAPVKVDSTVYWRRNEVSGHLRPYSSFKRSAVEAADMDISETPGLLHDGPDIPIVARPVLSSNHFFNEDHATDETYVPDASLQSAGEHVARCRYPSVSFFTFVSGRNQMLSLNGHWLG